MLYGQFERDFKLSCPRFRGRAVIHDRRLAPDGRERAFWHLVTRGDHRDYEGTPDYDRAGKLPWIRALIEKPDAPGVLCWNYREGTGAVRTYIWCEGRDFAVVLERLSKGAMRLVTAFHIQSDMRRQEMRHKHAQRVL
jgi:hypothetical protein